MGSRCRISGIVSEVVSDLPSGGDISRLLSLKGFHLRGAGRILDLIADSLRTRWDVLELVNSKTRETQTIRKHIQNIKNVNMNPILQQQTKNNSKCSRK